MHRELDITTTGSPSISGQRVFERARQLGHLVARTPDMTEDVGRQLLEEGCRFPLTGELEGEEEVGSRHAQILQ